MFDKIDYKTISILGREVRLSINHRERSISARLNDGYPAELRLTGYISPRLAIGASVRLEYGGDEDLLAGLYLGPLRLYAGINNRLLGSLIKTAKLGRRVTSIEAELGDRYGDPDEGTVLKVRGHLWDDDNMHCAASRAFSVDLLDSLLGKATTSERQVVEEREVVVPLPEGSFTTKARLVERFVTRARSPWKRFSRWVEFRETPAPVPQKGSDSMSFYNMGGPWTGISGNTIEEGVAEFVRRVLETRGRYGGKAWAAGVPSVAKSRDSHEVSVWQVIDGKEREVWRGDLWHKRIVSPAVPGLDFHLSRHPVHGGVVVHRAAVDSQSRRGKETLPLTSGSLVLQADKLFAGSFAGATAQWKVYGSPIGPAPAASAGAQQPAAEDVDQQWKQLTSRLRGDAIDREVRETMAQLDTTPPGPTEEAEGLSLRERALAGARRPGIDIATGSGSQAVVQAFERRGDCLHPVTEPVVLDEYLGETSQRYTVALGDHKATYQAVSAMSEVLGDGEADLPPSPVDTRPWLPTGDLVVTVARGELKTIVRLPRAASYRIGAHKDAEVRLQGAHMIAAALLQQDGAVWICRGADNVAVDLLGLDTRETVRLREGAEVQIGQLYTLTIISAAHDPRSIASIASTAKLAT